MDCMIEIMTCQKMNNSGKGMAGIVFLKQVM